MIGYKVGDRLFYNPYTAFAWASKNDTHRFPEFCFYDQEFARCNWSQEPTQSWQELLRIRASMLRQKYDRLILAFSGGTDSHTCYQVFRELNIHIDEIIVTYSSDNLNNAPKYNAEWLVKNHYDPMTKITLWHRQNNEVLRDYNNTDWFSANCGDLRRFDLTIPGPMINQYLSDTHGGHRWALITGYEKPHLFYRNQRWWATHLDGVYHAAMGWPNLEMFYITPDLPELHIKQHYLLLRAIKASAIQPREGWNSPQNLGKNSVEEYYWFAQACGRKLDILYGCSFDQKNYNQSTLIKDADVLLNKKIVDSVSLEPFLKESLQAQDSLAANYINGWRELQADHTLIEYMTRHSLLSSKKQMIADYHKIWGKFYPLGEPV